MLHEVLLSLSGQPSPLLRASGDSESCAHAGITPPERQLLASAARLGDVHKRLTDCVARVSASHPSVICRAVAAAIQSGPLAAFQRKVLQVEDGILKQDPDLVGAYNSVPLTAVISHFQPWVRKMDWLQDLTRFIEESDGGDREVCRGAALIDRLRVDLQSGYLDVAESALGLVSAAESAWLRQLSAWILYGRLPAYGGEDFFVQKSPTLEDGHVCLEDRLPSFVAPDTASSMFYIGKCLDQIRAAGRTVSGPAASRHLSTGLQQLGELTSPLKSAQFSRTIAAIRLSLSETILRQMLPPERLFEALALLREFFLLGRGQFAVSLSHEADDKMRNRWRRAGRLLAHEEENESDSKYDDKDLAKITVMDGELSSVLNKTWAVLVSMQGQHADEDEQLELARSLLRLRLVREETLTLERPRRVPASHNDVASLLEALPFRNMLFSVPVLLSIDLPSPLEMVIPPSDLLLYSYINAYLLSVRRAHVHLTDLWKLTSLRRFHPAPRGAGSSSIKLRRRWSARWLAMRGSWATASAALFFLGETEAYLQTEIVAGMWEGFRAWLQGTNRRSGDSGDLPGLPEGKEWRQEGGGQRRHDPQSLATAHGLYLRTLLHRLLLTQPTFTEALHMLLVHVDQLVFQMGRLHSIFTTMDVDADAGMTSAATQLELEQGHVLDQLRETEAKLRLAMSDVVEALRRLENDAGFAAEWEAPRLATHDEESTPGPPYRPARIGGVNRLLMKLGTGTWLGSGHDGGG